MFSIMNNKIIFVHYTEHYGRKNHHFIAQASKDPGNLR